MDFKIVERLRKSRTELTQSELADKLGVSTSTYRRLLEGSTPVTMDLIQRVAAYFNVSEGTLINTHSLFNPLEMHDDQVVDTWIMVRLDGSKKTLDHWIRKLTSINNSI